MKRSHLLGAVFVCFVFFSAVFPVDSFAMPASPHPFQVKQPDGSVITLRIKGDEYFNWLEDESGYSVIKSKDRYVYARLTATKELGPTEWEVGKVFPQALGLSKRILPPPNVIKQRRIERQAVNVPGVLEEPVGGAAAPAGVATIGSVPNLVIMVRFSDHASRTLPSAADINVLFNAVGGDPLLAPTGSVRDVYLENSYGQMDLQSTNTGWIDVSQTEAYYAGSSSGLTSTIWAALTEALSIADASVDFSQYDTDGNGYIDAITFIHSGYGAEWGGFDADGANYVDRIWSHKWQITPDWVSAEGVRVSQYDINPALWGTSGSVIGRIGVIAHETGHFLGLPDLYDTNGGGEGIGSYAMMANSWGFDGSQYYPPHFSAWSKLQLGWTTATVVTNPGTYTLLQAETFQDVIRIDNGFPSGEYLLVENRQPVGFESDMPQGGLAIWHIDETKPDNTQEGYPAQAGWPTNGNHYRVALLQADGNYDLEIGNNRGDAGDLYHGAEVSGIGPGTVPGTDSYQGGVINSTGIELADISTSASSMSFTYPAKLTAPIFVFPSGGETLHAATMIDVTWNTNGAPVSSYYDLAYRNNCTPDVYISDDMESGSGFWSVSHGAGIFDWVLGTVNPHSGTSAWFASDPGTVSDQYLSSASLVTVPASGQLDFWHSYDTQANFDGGVVEISTDGVIWDDLGPYMTQGGYNSTISTCCTNPIGGRAAFSGNSGGYVETLVDLSSYSGQNVYIRFRMTSVSSLSGNGWSIDDVSLIGGVSPWIPIGTTSPGASSLPWTVPLNTGNDFCLSIQGTAPGYTSSTPVVTNPFTVSAADSDGDGIPDGQDNCPTTANPGQEDGDLDGTGDACDNCVFVANGPNTYPTEPIRVQCDTDADGYGNICDADLNNSGGVVNFTDLTLFKGAFGIVDANADLNCTGGVVNFTDLTRFKQLFGSAPGPSCCAP